MVAVLIAHESKLIRHKKYHALKLSDLDVVFSLPINVKMPLIVGILTFMGRINYLLS